MWEIWLSLLCAVNLVVLVWCCNTKAAYVNGHDNGPEMLMFLVKKNHALFSENQLLKRKLMMKDNSCHF